MIASSDDAILLQDAPARFLAADWAKLVALTGSEAKALESLSSRDDGIIAVYRDEVMKAALRSAEHKAQSEKEKAIYLASKAMIEGFNAMLTSGRLAGSVIFSGSPQRQDAAPEIWSDLTLDFRNNRALNPAEGRSHSYVKIWKPASARSADELRDRMITWLTKRREKYSTEKRLALIELARAEFRSSFRIQVFNAAFGDVYGHKRGRPEGSQKNQKMEF